MIVHVFVHEFKRIRKIISLIRKHILQKLQLYQTDVEHGSMSMYPWSGIIPTYQHLVVRKCIQCKCHHLFKRHYVVINTKISQNTRISAIIKIKNYILLASLPS